ncbi:terminase TerL endonuclease subunit [Clostridium botulinum]|uniref:terminase TerL endonuclease subunit n=1 Tax=Clostridium botulinum TaxID=1491 RepID=UPI001C9ABE4D|nr:terminase TerL endonuclease subunit [Clostridium botulinum]MBY6809027.1 terminase large subunit [Clostridium botulinum]MBY6822268.1 terminase large subunit [Clostridium botulinum]MBY6832942.1 terminase large subunit [Clostridium botulinum]MBY6972170.1 terminase large subunit [Clostridium botulinum]HBJ1649405.1 terminase large subunit [Clostridium botulinum]
MMLLDNAIKYANDVVEGNEITTKEITNQCKIFLNDYENRQYNDDFKYYFDENKLQTIENLLKLFNYATGFVAGQPVLEGIVPFQCFFLTNIFGWRFKDKPEKFRYNDITLYIARKNAKTWLVSLVFILLMLTEQNYSEFYSICLSKELASEIRKAMVQTLESSPLILKYFKISKTLTGRIECKLTHSFFQPRVAEAGKNNSVRPSAFVSDEHGNFKENSNFKAMQSGQKNVVNPLTFRTTTAYAIDNSIMLSDLDYIRKVLDGVVENERQFALLYYSTKEHLWDDIGMYMSCPLRVEENYETIRETRAKALVKEDEVEEYITKDMNYFLPANSGESFTNAEEIEGCKLDEDVDWTGRSVYLGVDLAETDDNTAVTMVTYDEDTETIYVKSWAIIPTDRVEMKSQRERVDYKREIEKGNCFSCGDDRVDYKRIEQFVEGIEEKYNVNIIQLGYDRRNAMSSAQKWENDSNIECVEVIQFSRVLHAPIKWLHECLLSKKIKYYNNKLLDIELMNCRAKRDTNMGWYLDKKASAGKIDMVFALVDALYLLQQELLNGQSWVSQR